MTQESGSDGPSGGWFRTAATVVWQWAVGIAVLVGVVAAYFLTSALGLSSPFHGQSAPAGTRESAPVVSQSDPPPDNQDGVVDTGFCKDPVSWKDASSVVGEVAFIEGPVVSVQAAESEAGSPTFINIGADYPDPSRFTVVIWGEGRLAADFDPPEEVVMGADDPEQIVCVTGQVTSYQGVPQIAMTSQSQMKLARPR